MAAGMSGKPATCTNLLVEFARNVPCGGASRLEESRLGPDGDLRASAGAVRAGTRRGGSRPASARLGARGARGPTGPGDRGGCGGLSVPAAVRTGQVSVDMGQLVTQQAADTPEGLHARTHIRARARTRT